MSIGEIVIKVELDMTEYAYEVLEDDIRNLFERKGIKADIFDSVTGNSTRTREGMMAKSENMLADQTINGMLTFGEKIWFNDDLRCRLRICGWTRDQIEKLRTAKFVDLTITDFKDDDVPGVVVSIVGWDTKDIGHIEERCE